MSAWWPSLLEVTLSMLPPKAAEDDWPMVRTLSVVSDIKR